MDTIRFDALSRSLVSGSSRRTFLARLAGGLAVLLPHGLRGEVAAKKKRRRRNHKKRNTAKPCVPRCAASNACGDDGCGTSCGACEDNHICHDGTCVCVPDCGRGVHCGGDGCGGTCACDAQSFCQDESCVPCDPPCPEGERCVHGTCTCDPFDNTCPDEADGQCTCGAIVRLDPDEFLAACVDRSSACDLDRPCASNAECPVGSVCLLGCADPPAPNPNRCSRPCVPV